MAPALVGYLLLSLDLHIFYIIWILLFLATVILDRDALTLRGALVLTLIVGGIWLVEQLLKPSDHSWQELLTVGVLQYLIVGALTAYVLFVILRRRTPEPPH
jgi:hypothetical protein